MFAHEPLRASLYTATSKLNTPMLYTVFVKQTILRVLWVLAGASVALAYWPLHVVRPADSTLLLASLGGSTLFLFGLTATLPPTQPRALFGGHLISALIGVICYQLFGDATFGSW